jgi:hypothetical protein
MEKRQDTPVNFSEVSKGWVTKNALLKFFLQSNTKYIMLVLDLIYKYFNTNTT